MDQLPSHDPWDIYDRTVPPWDTGRAQPAITQLGAEGRLQGRVLDISLFQVFSDAQRPPYVHSLAAVVPSGGRVFVLCFSDRQPGRDGPRRISQAEIRDSFADGWIIDGIDEVLLETRRHGTTVIAWLADIRRR
jgi:hypothetical protein